MVELVISPKVERRLMQVLGNPTRCPHGNPIPGTGSWPSPHAFSLSEARSGQQVVVERIVEEAEDDLDLMAYLERSGIVPRAQLEVVEVAPAAGLVTVARDGDRISLGTPAAQQVRVLDAADAEQDPELAPRTSRPEPAAYAERIRELAADEAARTRSA